MDGSLRLMNDLERLCLARHWADETYAWLCDEMNRGRITAADEDRLQAICDGLMTFADTLHAVTTAFPPATPGRHLRVVK